MASTLRTNRLTPFISLTTVMVAALTACGGNSGDDTTTPTVAAPVFPSAGFGQITALATGLIEPGTYVVAGCVPEGSTSPLQRKIRFNTDGSVQWLNAAAADAVLYTYTPSVSERDDRSLYYFRPNNWSAQMIRYDATSGAIASYFRTSPAAVNVVYANNTVAENCPAPFTPTLNISSAGVAARLGSAAALNGSTGFNSGAINLDAVSFTSININAAGAITTQTSEPGSSVVAWGSWLATTNDSFDNYFEERYLTRNAGNTAAGTPANPAAWSYLRHPTLQGQGAGSTPGTLRSVGFGIARNTTGSGAATVLYNGSN
jgi:hypothetical protein